MKVLFVDNLLLKRENDVKQIVLQPHLGLISLIAVVEKAGHNAALYDPKLDIVQGKLSINDKLYYRIAREIMDKDPGVVGFTSLGCNFICTAKIAMYIRREMPGIPILLGGPHATVLDRNIMREFPQFDCIVRNEAELKIVPVLDALKTGNFSPIPGITFRNGSEIIANPGDSNIENLDDLPFPAYHAYPIKELGLRSLRVEAGRGCPFKCTFCSTATFFGRRYRLKSARLLRNELDFLYNEYGIDDFSLNHDLFTVNRTKVVEFCQELAARKYTWKCSARMDCVDHELLSLMQQSGCRSIYYGIETGSQRMQEISQKKLDLDIFDNRLESTLSLGISPTVSFITGYPQETLEDQNSSIRLIGKCLAVKTSLDLNVQLHLLTPEPGTALIRDFGDRLKFDNHISDFNFPTLEADDEQMMQSRPDIFMNHHYFETVLPRKRNIFVCSFFELLSPLGKEVRQQLLNCYENELTSLVDDVYLFINTRYPDLTINIERFVRYIEHTFSENNYLTSLIKYMYELFMLRSGLCAGDEPAVTNGKAAYRLNKNVRLIRSIHNCPQIIQHLKTRRKLSAAITEKRIDLVVQFVTEEEESYVKNYTVNRQLATLIDSVGKGDTGKEKRQTFKDLCAAGILVYG